MVDDLMPASSPLCSLISWDLNFLLAAHFIYMRLNISAQSWLSVPPAPAWISTYAFKPSVSLDKKDGVKFNLIKDKLDLSVNNTSSGDGNETLSVKFDHELDISFNSRYLIDVASQLDGDSIEIYFKDSGSPALNKDPGDFDSIFVVMPMKG